MIGLGIHTKGKRLAALSGPPGKSAAAQHQLKSANFRPAITEN